MSGRTIGAFALGLAVGSAGLAAGLWRAGMLRTAVVQPAAQELPVASGTLPDMQAGKQFRSHSVPALPLSPPPQPERSTIPSTLGTADRAAPPDDGPPALLLPVQGVQPAQLTDTYDDTRGGSRRHEALDIMAPRGTPVLAADEGNVVKLFTSERGGLTVYQFDNSRQWCYYYAHLDRYAPGLREGMLLRRGDTLGLVGSTGDADPAAPHLHFAVFRLGPEKLWWEGTPVNPFTLFRNR